MGSSTDEPYVEPDITEPVRYNQKRDDALLRETILRFAMVRHGIKHYSDVLDMWRNDVSFYKLVETAIGFYNSKQSERNR